MPAHIALKPNFTDRLFTDADPPSRHEAPIGWDAHPVGIPADQVCSYLNEQRALAAICHKGGLSRTKKHKLASRLAQAAVGSMADTTALRCIRQLEAKGLVELTRTNAPERGLYLSVVAKAEADGWAMAEWLLAHPNHNSQPSEPVTHTVADGVEFQHVEHVISYVDQPDLADLADQLLLTAAGAISVHDDLVAQLDEAKGRFVDLVGAYEKLQAENIQLRADVAHHKLVGPGCQHQQLQANYDQLVKDFAELQADHDKLRASLTRTQQAQRTYNIIEALDDRSRTVLMELLDEEVRRVRS